MEAELTFTAWYVKRFHCWNLKKVKKVDVL